MNINYFNVWLNDDGRKPLIMGILNVTPDSFSDGGIFKDHQEAITYALQMEKETNPPC